jgi:hypothetical protein
MRKLSALTCFFVILMIKANAQNMNSPYSAYGVGELQEGWADRSSGMANTSVSLLSTPGFLLNKNPASLVGLERSLGQVDLAISGKSSTFTGTPIAGGNNTAHDVVIKRFSLSAKMNNHWASSVGFLPFSYVSYSFTGQKSIEGSTSTYTGNYDGNGGLHQIFWNNAFLMLKNHIAMGLRTSFIFGSINQTETLSGTTISSIPVVAQTSTYYNNFRFEYGAIYNGNLNKNWKLSLGGKITTKTDLRTDQTLTVTEGSSTIESNKDLGTGTFSLPWAYDAGIALTNKGKSTFTVDYSFANWTGLNPGTATYTMVNSNRLSAGVQFSNQLKRYNMVAEKSYFQAGVFAGQSYLQVKGQQINELGLTAGYGGFLSRGLNFHLAIEGGRRGTVANGLVRENYVQATIALSYREILYSKGRKYD